MARQAQADGIAIVCATPHVRHDHDVRIAELPERVAALNALLAQEGVDVQIAKGGEVAETALAGLDDAELRAAALGDGPWVLLEPAPGPLGDGLLTAIDRIASAGLRAIVAHPERHAGAGFEQTLTDAVARGALVQATAAHVLDDGAGPVLVRLAGERLVHLVGSDAHTSQWGRPVALRAAVERLGEAGADVAAFAAEAPAAILRGEVPQPS